MNRRTFLLGTGAALVLAACSGDDDGEETPANLTITTLPGPGAGNPDDVLLRTGDVVFLEARDREIFYTGGLLPPGVHVLPRDRDLDVIEAIAQVRGPLFNGAFGGSNLSGALLQSGLGNPSPSLAAVIRRTPDGRQVVINVDLRMAMRDAQERLLLRAGAATANVRLHALVAGTEAGRMVNLYRAVREELGLLG